MIVAANITQPSRCVARGHENEDEQPRCDVADAFDGQIGAGGSLAEIWLHTVAGGGDARRDNKPCADEHDARGYESGERVGDGCCGHVEHSWVCQ
jgi:hypothetical protein